MPDKDRRIAEAERHATDALKLICHFAVQPEAAQWAVRLIGTYATALLEQRIAALEDQAGPDRQRDRLNTFCPDCGPNVEVDEDGCCVSCGADATGPGVEKVAQLLEDLAHERIRTIKAPPRPSASLTAEEAREAARKTRPSPPRDPGLVDGPTTGERLSDAERAKIARKLGAEIEETHPSPPRSGVRVKVTAKARDAVRGVASPISAVHIAARHMEVVVDRTTLRDVFYRVLARWAEARLDETGYDVVGELARLIEGLTLTDAPEATDADT